MLVAEGCGIAERNSITQFWIGSTFSRVSASKKNR